MKRKYKLSDFVHIDRLVILLVFIAFMFLSPYAFGSSSGSLGGGVAESAGVANTVTNQGAGNNLQVVILDIGTWNMDTVTTQTVAHNLSFWRTVRQVSALIYRDDTPGPTPWDFNYTNNSGTGNHGIRVDGTNVYLDREASGFFDSTDFNDTSSNRGYIILWYTEGTL